MTISFRLKLSFHSYQRDYRYSKRWHSSIQCSKNAEYSDKSDDIEVTTDTQAKSISNSSHDKTSVYCQFQATNR